MIIRYIYISFQLYCLIVYVALTDGRAAAVCSRLWQATLAVWRTLLLRVRVCQTHDSLMLLFTREV